MLTVATFSKPEEAHMLRLRLEAGGVPAGVRPERDRAFRLQSGSRGRPEILPEND